MSTQIRGLLIPIFLGLFTVTWGQNEAELSTKMPEFSLQRDLEDYRFLLGDSTSSTCWRRLKYIPLGQQSSLSLGGDFRSEFQVLHNEDWRKGEDDRPLFLRFMWHTDWRFGRNFRLFAQFKSAFTVGRNGPVLGLNADHLDLHQFFAAFPLGNGTLEVGRRELWYGSRRLISIREGTNVRQSFDGLRWIWEDRTKRLDLLAYAYNPQVPGVFDNRPTLDQLLWGVYYVNKDIQSSRMNIDLYYIGVRNKKARFEEGQARELRHSLGIRHWGDNGTLIYNSELIWQFGTFGGGRISAWTVSTDLYYRFSAYWKAGLKAEVISGDRMAQDGNLQTFNPLYPRGGYFGLLAVIGPANLFDVHPSIQFNPTKDWMVNLDWDFFWRHRLADGIYFPSGRLNIAGDNSEERFIGHQMGIQISRTLNRFMEIETSYFYFFAGPFLRATTEGAGFSQFGVSLSYAF
ncbi:MAG: alginate export family protein [Saprospiraceae bacterium]|nr:alginate export family protein [Saprospiraceae bacterium]